MNKVNWNDVIDTLQVLLVWFMIVIVGLCVTTLIVFDILAGVGTMDYLTNGNTFVALLISLATTGLLIALMFIGYNMRDNKSSAARGFAMVLLGMAILVYGVDVLFDSLTADVLRYGEIREFWVSDNPWIHMLFRMLLAGVSATGEFLALAIITGMPVLKKIINDALPYTAQKHDIPQSFPRQYNVDLTSKLPQKQPMSFDNFGE